MRYGKKLIAILDSRIQNRLASSKDIEFQPIKNIVW